MNMSMDKPIALSSTVGNRGRQVKIATNFAPARQVRRVAAGETCKCQKQQHRTSQSLGTSILAFFAWGPLVPTVLLSAISLSMDMFIFELPRPGNLNFCVFHVGTSSAYSATRRYRFVHGHVHI